MPFKDAGLRVIGSKKSPTFLSLYGVNTPLNRQFIDHLVSLSKFTLLPWGNPWLNINNCPKFIFIDKSYQKYLDVPKETPEIKKRTLIRKTIISSFFIGLIILINFTHKK